MPTRIRVLVIDDERLMRMSLRHVLCRDGHAVDTVRTAGEAFDALERQCYQLVLVDLDLPDGHGLDIVREVRKRQPGVRVVALTASGGRGGLRAALHAGAEAVLRKPFRLSLAVEQARLADRSRGEEPRAAVEGPGARRPDRT